MSFSASPAPHETKLAVLLQLERDARACQSQDELEFLIVNDTHALVPYRQAVLWYSDTTGNGRILALSGLAVPDPHAPFNQWLAGLLALLARQQPSEVARPIDATDDPAGPSMWAEHLPRFGWWLPLAVTIPGDAMAHAGLLLLRDTPWPDPRQPLLDLLMDAYAHAWRALRLARLTTRRRLDGFYLALIRPRKAYLWFGVLGALLLFLCLPMRQSVLAPGEIVARAPAMVRAPLPGVVDRIAVQPNQTVQTGDLLAELDAREMHGRLESARQVLATADAELRQIRQQALVDERSKAGLALVEGRRAQAASDVSHLEASLARTRLYATRPGVAIFDDVSDWIGRPVAQGERIMMVADPADTELEMRLPVADAIALAPGDEVRLFLNTSPSEPLAARLLRVSYRATPTAEGTLAFHVRASFEPDADTNAIHRRVGMKGTAKLYGERTTMLFYVMRRPLATLRVWIGS